MEEKWFTVRKRYVPALWPLHTFWAWPVHKFFNVPTTGKVLSVWDKGDYQGIYENQRARIDLGKAVGDKIIKECLNHTEFRSRGIQAGEKTAAFCRQFATHSETAPLPEFISFFDGLIKEYAAIMSDNMFYWLFGSGEMEQRVKKQLTHLTDEEIKLVFETMSHPHEDSYSKKLEREMSALTELVKEKGADSEIVRDEIKKFSNAYFWFPYEYVGPAIWNEESVMQIINKDSSSGTKKVEIPTSTHSKLEEECVVKYHLSEEIVTLFKFIQTLGLMQDDRKRYNSEISYYVNGVILANLAKKLGISREEALYLDQELIALFEKDTQLFSRRLAARKDMLVEVIEDGIFTFYEGRVECEKLFKSLGIHFDLDIGIKEIKGQTAHKGKVKGRVRVLKTSQVSDFADGDIIVTGMTTPDFAPLMKKASAIITNEGGITCHAAIVSRELGIPCIIGTKVATQVLKDGMRVEVDADKGIVTILA